MSALEYAKTMGREKLLEQMASLGMMEYGLCEEKLAVRLQAAVKESEEEGKELRIVCALNNADIDGVLLEILKSEPEKVMEGIAVAAYALGVEKKYLYVPEYAAELVKKEEIKATADKYSVELMAGLVDIRANQGCALLHMVTAANLAEAFAGEEVPYETGIYISVNGSKLKKIAADTKIKEVVQLDAAKAVQLGYRYVTPDEAAELAVTEVKNAVIRVLTEKDCIVAETEKRLMASRKQSCGKCVFCREGLLQLQYMQKEVTEGKGKQEFVAYTKEIGEAMTFSTPCSMGQNSSQIALSAVEKFAEEYETHIKKKACPAGVCFSAETIYIDPKICDGCGECMDVCKKDCIEGKSGYIHMIDEFDCDGCGKCMEVCEAGAIIRTAGKVPKLPNRLTKVGRFKKR